MLENISILTLHPFRTEKSHPRGRYFNHAGTWLAEIEVPRPTLIGSLGIFPCFLLQIVELLLQGLFSIRESHLRAAALSTEDYAREIELLRAEILYLSVAVVRLTPYPTALFRSAFATVFVTSTSFIFILSYPISSPSPPPSPPLPIPTHSIPSPSPSKSPSHPIPSPSPSQFPSPSSSTSHSGTHCLYLWICSFISTYVPSALARSDMRPPGMRTVPGPILTFGNILSWRLIMK